MNFNRKWTVFAADAEVNCFGTVRLVQAHNDAVIMSINTMRGCRDMLSEAAKQFRIHDDSGHANMCEVHASGIAKAIDKMQKDLT